MRRRSSAPVTVQNVVNYTVVIDVNNSQLKLMPGMTANVKVQVADAHNVLKVPNMALRLQPPPDVIDSARVRAMRSAFAFGGQAKGDAGRQAEVGSQDPSGAGGGKSGAGLDMRKRFQAVRDSITAAHGGEISQEELRAEMRKVLRGTEERQPAPAVAQRKTVPEKKAQFGLDIRFPEYEKSPYVPLHDVGRARVWIVNAKGMLEPVIVRTGVTDGRYTEVVSTDLKPGDQIVLGVTSLSDEQDDKAVNPLAGGGQRGPRGGFR